MSASYLSGQQLWIKRRVRPVQCSVHPPPPATVTPNNKQVNPLSPPRPTNTWIVATRLQNFVEFRFISTKLSETLKNIL